MVTDHATTANESTSIASAPIRPREEFGPCLLWPSAYGDPEWVIGRWNGREWCDAEGLLYTHTQPTWWAPIPPVPKRGAEGVAPIAEEDTAEFKAIEPIAGCAAARRSAVLIHEGEAASALALLHALSVARICDLLHESLPLRRLAEAVDLAPDVPTQAAAVDLALCALGESKRRVGPGSYRRPRARHQDRSEETTDG